MSPEKRRLAQVIFQDAYAALIQGDHHKADALLLEALQLDPENPDTLNFLGIRSYEKKDFANALNFLNQANQIAQDSAQTLNNLGLVYIELFQFEEAHHFFKLALASNPNIPEVHNNYGNALKGLKKNREALDAYTKAISLRANYAEAHSNCGVIFLEQGQTQEAIRSFERSIDANPHSSIAFNNLGNALTQLKEYENAFQCFERALQINSKYLDAYLNFGNSLKKSKQYSAAIDCYQHALKLNSSNAKTFYFLGEIYYEIGKSALAKTYYAKCLELDPLNIESKFALLIAQIPKVHLSVHDAEKSRESFVRELEILERCYVPKQNAEITASILSRHPFYLAYFADNNRDMLSRYGDLSIIQARDLQNEIDNISKSPQSSKKFRIGIVSNYLSNHPVWNAITKAWVDNLNPEIFELHLFNTNGIEDIETTSAKLKVANYVNCKKSLSDTAQLIKQQNIEVLLYPEIGMDATTKALACLRLAPIQVASWGHPETSGLPTIDFFLSGELFETDEATRHYCENLIRLPGIGTNCEFKTGAIVTPDFVGLGIENNSPILICAGSPSKYTPRNDYIFIEIAKNLKKCQFIFFNFEENLTEILQMRLQQVFLDAGLNAREYIRFIPFLKQEEFYGLLHKADLYLDTIGFSGFNTAMQAITCNLPIVTLEGKFMRGRLASALIHRLGLHELVCESEEAYIKLATDLIQSPALLKSYKESISRAKVSLSEDLSPISALEQFLTQQAENIRN